MYLRSLLISLLTTASLLGSKYPAEPFVSAVLSPETIKKVSEVHFPHITMEQVPLHGLTADKTAQDVYSQYLPFFIIQDGENATLPVNTLPVSAWKAFNLYGNGSLLQCIKRTETRVGWACLTHLLSLPADAHTIAQRQRAIHSLLTSSDYQKLRSSLQKIRTCESDMIRWFMHIVGLKKINRHPTFGYDYPTALAVMHKLIFPAFLGTMGGIFGFSAYTAYVQGNYGDMASTGLVGSCCMAGWVMLFNDERLFIRHTRTILTSLAQIVEEAQKMVTIIKENPALAELPDFRGLTGFFDEAWKNTDIQKLLGLLKAKTFNPNTSAWFDLGYEKNVIAARYQLVMTQGPVKDLLRGIGLVDAHLSIASLIKNYQDTDHPYSLVTFVDDEKPYLSLKNAWSPYTSNPSEHLSLTCGRGAPQHLILPNPDTDAIKTLQACALLAHTFGIAPAQEATMSHFSLFHTCKTTDHYGLSERLVPFTFSALHGLILYQQDNVARFDHFLKIVAPQLAQTGQYLMIAATSSPDAQELTKSGFGTLAQVPTHA